MIKDYTLPIYTQKQVSPEIYLLVIKNRVLASALRPGQFVEIRVDKQTTYLRRPLSVHRVTGERIQFLYRVKGKGTHFLSRKKSGELLQILGPLGKGFTINKKFIDAFDKIVVIAGGIGIAPVFFLLEELRKFKKKKPEVFFGACNKKEIVLQRELKSIGIPIHYATNDCSYGYGGRVTSLLSKAREKWDISKVLVYACGPEPMYKSLKDIFHLPSNDIYCEALFERLMGCGFGVCNSCSIMTNQGMRKVCTDGPAFNLAEVVLE